MAAPVRDLANEPGTLESMLAKAPMLRAAIQIAFSDLDTNQKEQAAIAGVSSSTFNAQLNGHHLSVFRLCVLGRKFWMAGKGAVLRAVCELAGLARADVLHVFDADQASEDTLREQIQRQADEIAELKRRDSQREDRLDALERLVRESMPRPTEAPAEERDLHATSEVLRDRGGLGGIVGGRDSGQPASPEAGRDRAVHLSLQEPDALPHLLRLAKEA
jgi:hypothetical protein